MKKILSKIPAHPVTTAILFTVILVVFYIASTSTDHYHHRKYGPDTLVSKFLDDYQKHYGVYALVIPDSLTFAGEKVPVNYFDVYENLDRELHSNVYWHSNFFLFLKRANRFFPVIEPILKKNGIPDDMKYLCVAESGFTHAVSPAGATGFWQFMKATAESYGLRINEEIDERYHIEKSTEAACRHLKDLYKVYKSWALVAAAYNMGQGGLDKQMKSQKVNSYYDLMLNDETARYVFRIMAIKLIFENPKKFGFNFLPRQLYTRIPVNEIKIDSTITDLPGFAIDQGINYKILRIFNPWIRQSQLTVNEGQQYIITVPQEGYREMEKLSASFDYALSADTTL
jgi:hypothetical protein